MASLLFLAINLLFAAALWFGGDCIQGANIGPNTFADSFSFSVQTFTTIGYGSLTPNGYCGDYLVAAESLIGIISIALLTGLVYAKFSLPTSRVAFSDNCIIYRRNGKLTLSFRLSNTRGNDVVEARISVTCLKRVVTLEGEWYRKLFDLKMERDSTPLFLYTWSVFHVIDESSPLWGLGPQELIDGNVGLMVSVVGLDGTFSQQVYARHYYEPADVLFFHRFQDMVRFDVYKDGKKKTIIDLDMLSEVSPQINVNTSLDWETSKAGHPSRSMETYPGTSLQAATLPGTASPSTISVPSIASPDSRAPLNVSVRP